MTKTIKMLLGLAALLVLQAPARATQQQDAVTATNDAIAFSYYVPGGTTLPSTSTIANFTYIGTSATASVGINASSVAFYAPVGTLDTSIGGTSYGATGGVFDITVATVATMGQLCDLVNASTNYRCTLTGAIRTDSTTVILPVIGQNTGANNLANPGGWNINVGTSTIMTLGIIPPYGRRVILNQCQINSTNGGAVTAQVYGRLRGYSSGVDNYGAPAGDSYLVWSSTLTSNTTAKLPDSPSPTPWMEFATNQFNTGGTGTGAGWRNPPTGSQYNGKVVVRAGFSSNVNIANTALNFVQCNGIFK